MPNLQSRKLSRFVIEGFWPVVPMMICDFDNIEVLRAYNKALYGNTDRRWKIEDAQVLTEVDSVIYSKDLMTVHLQEITDISEEQTFVNGVVH